jgi:hypothetical protein
MTYQSNRKIVNLLAQSMATTGFAILAIAAIGLAATPNPQPGCPDGWIPRPPELNPALGKCVPNNLAPAGGFELQGKQRPDLTIKNFRFSPNAPQNVSIRVLNQGNGIAKPSKMKLVVRKINGTPVGREIEVNVPVFQPSESKNITIDASSILPGNVQLKDTSFRVDVDSSQLVKEVDETNNRMTHNQ